MSTYEKVQMLLLAVLLFSLPCQADNKLVGFWNFNEKSGLTASDGSGSSNHGSILGPTWTEGKCGSGLAFDGINDYVKVADNTSLDITAAITLEAWICPTDVDKGEMCIIDKYEVSGYSLGLNYDNNVNREVCFLLNLGGNKVTLRSSSKLENNKWYYIIGTYDGATMKLNINGKDEKSTSVSGLITTNQVPLLIGAASTTGTSSYSYYFKGKIDEVRISAVRGRIYVVNPNGGETWPQNDVFDLQWSTGALGGSVKIILVKGIYPDLYDYQTIAGNSPNDGLYSWTIPSTYDVYNNYRLYVQSLEKPDEYDHSDAVWAITNYPTKSPLPTSSIISNFRLEQNYPNPFNPVTCIAFSIPHPAKESWR